jgi:hypothetical protein
MQIWTDFRNGNSTHRLAILADCFGICGVSLAVFLAPFFAGVNLARLDKYFLIVGQIVIGGVFMVLTLAGVSVFWTIYDESPLLRLFPRRLFRICVGGLGLFGVIWISYWVYTEVRECARF